MELNKLATEGQERADQAKFKAQLLAKESISAKVKEVKAERYQELKHATIGKYLTRTILAPDGKAIGLRGEIITNSMFIQAEKYAIIDQIFDNSSPDPINFLE